MLDVANAIRPLTETERVEPGGRPERLTCGDIANETARLILRRARASREKRESNGSEAQLEQPASARRLEVVVALWNCPCDAVYLTGVQSEIVVQRDLPGGRRIGIRQIDLRRAGVEQRMPEGKLRELRRTLRREYNRGILLSKREEPLVDSWTEQRVHERHPRLVHFDQRWPSAEPPFDASEEVQQHGNRGAIVEGE